MESLGMLKDADDRFRNISISHDMNKSDREQCKEMVKQAIEKSGRPIGGIQIFGKRCSGEHESDKGSENINKEISKQEINKNIKNLN